MDYDDNHNHQLIHQLIINQRTVTIRDNGSLSVNHQLIRQRWFRIADQFTILNQQQHVRDQ